MNTSLGPFVAIQSEFPLIAEGEYAGEIIEIKPGTFFGSPKILFQVLLRTDYGDQKLTFFTNVKLTSDGKIKEPRRSTKLFQTLKLFFPNTAVIDICLDDLIGVQCMAEVKTSKLDPKKTEKRPNEWYSTIVSIKPLVEIEHSNNSSESLEDLPF